MAARVVNIASGKKAGIYVHVHISLAHILATIRLASLAVHGVTYHSCHIVGGSSKPPVAYVKGPQAVV
jgi:hypothetical protein